VKQPDDAGQLGGAGTGPAPQQAPAAAGFSWPSATSSAVAPGQQTAATSGFEWSRVAKVSRPPQMPLPAPAGSTQLSTPSAAQPSPPTPPTQPLPVNPSGLTAATSPLQHTQPLVYGPTATHPATTSLLDRAKANDQQALATLFGQFIPSHEQIVDSQYLGVLGMWGIGTHSFAALTTHRIAAIDVSIFGRVRYQDGALECINSSVVAQPSLLGLYLYVGSFFAFFAFFGIAGWSIHPVVAVLVVLLGVLLLPIILRHYYRFNKNGLELWVREGISIVVFIDRKRMINAKRFYRLFCDQREERLRAVGQP